MTGSCVLRETILRVVRGWFARFSTIISIPVVVRLVHHARGIQTAPICVGRVRLACTARDHRSSTEDAEGTYCLCTTKLYPKLYSTFIFYDFTTKLSPPRAAKRCKAELNVLESHRGHTLLSK